MGNCCVRPPVVQSNDQQRKKGKKKANPSSADYGLNNRGGGGKLSVLSDLTGRDIGISYELGQELGRGEFGITEVEIMKHFPLHPNIVRLKDTHEDDVTVHLVMELCEGGELIDRIIARGRYAERAAAIVTKMISCHIHGAIHRDLKPKKFLFANKKETTTLKAIDFGLSVFFKLGERLTKMVESPYYMAPEVLKQNYGPEVNVKSAGVIRYIILCGIPSFWVETETEVVQAIIRSVQVLGHPWLQHVKKAPNVSLGETEKARLKQFSVMNKLKKRALRVVTEHLSMEEVAGIKKSFQMMDVNNNGKITLGELNTTLFFFSILFLFILQFTFLCYIG
ncbi:hypothetical protein GIB67_017906 [Kingdonia uniflora]|uniref:Calcium-dependent protein kinase n=1 Tax=Kingdonia uniflora TaxID=39325 RepID=A0A7J7NEE1_9MAGN|nr:hypothetical protein GIB67_017906 [Kingdonia uniflora]